MSVPRSGTGSGGDGQNPRASARGACQYNNEGRECSEQFGDGPVVFHELLARWRRDGGIDDVLAGAE
ncbi:hypothetical protein ABZ027_06890 [Streptomyces sp. NPDC006332]|uniref:hypothetical protein n=1 Tax=Streptomyces sp. NPDC006332 TaxID=3155456 RepID=UPI0033A81D6E